MPSCNRGNLRGLHLNAPFITSSYHFTYVLYSMRVKIECGPPLPSLKVWFVVPAVATIAELKDALCSELPALAHLSVEGLTLTLEGFELIDSSSIDVIRDGEVIT